MSVTLSEVKRAARAHRAPLAGESAGYLVLAIADQVLKAPRLVQAEDIQLSEDGALRLTSGQASSDADAELSLRRALDQLLLVASSGSAALTRASRRTEPLGLTSLVRELEAALIPVNRSAARRALARVHRETARALESGNLPDEEEPRAPEPVAPVALAVSLAPAVALPAPTPAAPPAVVMPAPTPVIAMPAAPPAVALPAPTPVIAMPAAPPVFALPAPTPLIAMPAAPAVVAPLGAPSVIALPAPTPAAPPAVELREPNQEAELELDLDQDLETPALAPVLPIMIESQLDGVVSALCEQLPLPPQFVESDALTSALAVRAVSTAVSPAPAAEPEPEFLLDDDVEFEADDVEFATDAVDSSAAPTVMRAVEVEPVPLSAHDASSVPPAVELPLEARTRPEPVVLRRTLRPLLDMPSESEPLLHTPTLGSLAKELPILAPEQIAELSLAAEVAQSLLRIEEPTERMPDVLPLAPGAPIVESKKSDVSELLQSFQVSEPSASPGLCRAIKEMADLDLTPAPFAALIR